MLVCRLTADSELCTTPCTTWSTKGQGAAFQDNYFGKILLINFINTCNSLPRHFIFDDSLFIVS